MFLHLRDPKNDKVNNVQVAAGKVGKVKII